MNLDRFDGEIKGLLDNAYEAAMVLNLNHAFSPEEIKLLLVNTNIQSLIRIILLADENPEAHALNLKQMALGLMGLSDFIVDGIEKEEPSSTE